MTVDREKATGKEWIRRWGLPLALSLGFLLRLGAFLSDHSLWLDEAVLAVCFRGTPLIDLLRAPLEYGHVLPSGFVAMTWLSVQVFGYNDQALKLFPFISGVLTLPLFYLVARAYLPQPAVPWAVILFSFSAPGIVYSGEVKQYSTDLAVSLALLLIVARVPPRPKPAWLASYALTGVVAVWFSLPIVFILAGAGVYSILTALRSGRGEAVRMVIVCLLWAANWLFVFFVVMDGGHGDIPPGPWVVEFWRGEGAFPPSLATPAGVPWLMKSTLALFDRVADLRLSALAAALFVLGCIAAPRRDRTLFVVVSPILLCLIASYFERYPFSGRLLLFLVPGLLLMVASGVSKLPAESQALRLLIIALMVGRPERGWHPYQEIKPCLSRLQEGWKPGDRIYVYHWAEPAFRYYGPRYHIPTEGKLINPIPRYAFIKDVDARRRARGLRPVAVEQATVVWGVSEYLEHGRFDLDRLRGQGRVWFLFSHCGRDGMQYGTWTDYLDKLGTQREAHRFPGAALFLYDL